MVMGNIFICIHETLQISALTSLSTHVGTTYLCVLPHTPSLSLHAAPLAPQVIQSNGVVHGSYHQSGYNSAAADGYGNDSTMSPTTQTDEMPTWDDWDDEDPSPDYDRPTGRYAGQVVAGGNTTRGVDDTCKWSGQCDQQMGVEWGCGHCHCITGCVIWGLAVFCWGSCKCSDITCVSSPPLPSLPLPCPSPVGSSSSRTEVHADGRSRTVRRNVYRCVSKSTQRTYIYTHTHTHAHTHTHTHKHTHTLHLAIVLPCSLSKCGIHFPFADFQIL